MIKTIDFHGNTVVAPIAGKDMEVVAPLEDYFPKIGLIDDEKDLDNVIIAWFNGDEQTKKDAIRGRDDHKCVICGKYSEEVHEIIGKGAAGGNPALVPWNQITVCREHHELLQQYKWTVYRFDPLDEESGLIVIDQGGHRIPNKDLWFYSRPNKDIVDEAHQRYEEMQEALLANRHNEARFTENSSWMKNNNGASVLGFGTHKSLLAQIGASSAWDHKMRTIYERATERGVWDKMKLIDPDRAHKILKKAKVGDDLVWLIPDDEVDEWFADATVLSTADFNRKFSDRFGGSRPHKRYAINGAVQVYEIEPGDHDGMDADIVIDGGKVVKGNVSQNG